MGLLVVGLAWGSVCALPVLAHAEVCANAAFRSGPSASLPDCRVYETVSPIESEGGEVYAPAGTGSATTEGLFTTARPFVVAAGGDAVAYVADPTTEGSGDIGNGNGNVFVATRGEDGGWTAVDQQPPARVASTYEGFSEDEQLSTGILESCYEPVLGVSGPGTPLAGFQALYSHITGGLGSEGFRALLTQTPQERLSCAGTGSGTGGFGTWAPGNGEPIARLLFAGGTPGLGDVLFMANDALTAEAREGPPSGPEENDLYDNVGGALRSVNILPGERNAEPDASFGSPWEENSAGSGWSGPPDFSHVISEDGSRIFWTDLNSGNRNLYVRENGAQTVQVDGAEAGCGSSCKSGEGWYWTATRDGQRAFFTDCHRLTAGSTAVDGSGCGIPGATVAGAGPQSNDLYEWDKGKLADLTMDHSDPHGADVQGVIGAGEEGEYVYFIAHGVLASNKNANGEAALAEAPNLYVRHGGATTFIARLAATDNENGVWYVGGGMQGHSGDWQPGLAGRTAEVTPDGRSVVFMSTRSLTGYDNVLGGAAQDEVYVYDATTGRLSCASCDPSGAPPSVGLVNDPVTSFLPVSANASYLPRWISNDGARVFFDAVESLVPQDENGKLDVYEWERDGAGSCRDEGGCVYLISGGRLTYTEASEGASALVGTDASGANVFFVTRDQLVAQDRDELTGLYDARVDGVQPPTPPICTGSGCQGVPSAPPLFEVPPSATFNGIGNFEPTPPAVKPGTGPLTRAQKLAKTLRACAKKPKKRRVRCRARAKRSYRKARSRKRKAGKKAKRSSIAGRRSHA